MKQTPQEAYEDLITNQSILDCAIMLEAIEQFPDARNDFLSLANAELQNNEARMIECCRAVFNHVKQYVEQVAIAQGVAQ